VRWLPGGMTEQPEYPYPDPIVRLDHVEELADDLLVVPNRGVQLVPNIGIIGGSEAVLVVDTGLGPRNAERVLAFARNVAKGRRIFLTTTHFHPEHAFGAQSFTGEVTYLANQAQAEDLRNKAAGYLQMFRGLGEPIARQLEGVELTLPEVVYDTDHKLDLGGRIVRLRATGRAHTRGDQIITVPDIGVTFTGDLVETGQFAIFPWFPPHDTDVTGLGWIAVMQRLVAQHPTTVVPGHGALGGTEILGDVLTYLEELRDETWVRRDSAMSEADIIAEVSDVLIKRHPDWEGREWLAPGVSCLCGEHDGPLSGTDAADV
jgi:glyoxylase-like metal-dependent hydrolase (beta-lactamase superfamily II)